MTTQTSEERLLNKVKLASKIVLKEDEKLFKELAKENQSPNKSEREKPIVMSVSSSVTNEQVQTGSDTITIATKSMKGCGREFDRNWICGEVDEIGLQLCSICKDLNQAHKQNWKGELEEWNKIHNYCYGTYAMVGRSILDDFDKVIMKRISKLTQALKILEGGK